MREILLTGAKQLSRALLVCTLLCTTTLWSVGRLDLLIGLVVGYLVGVVWYGVMFGRLWRSAEMSVAAAKRQVVVGAILRLLLLGTVLWAAIQVEFAQFLAVVGGFALVYVLGLIILALSNWR